jgi:hypothetical protein
VACSNILALTARWAAMSRLRAARADARRDRGDGRDAVHDFDAALKGATW